MSQSGGEHRQSERRELELPVYVGDAQNRVHGTIRFDTRDLSVGGAFLRSDLLFEVGEELDVEFQLPGGGTVRARARVAHVARDHVDGVAQTAAGMGISFSNLSERDREAVRAYLARG